MTPFSFLGRISPATQVLEQLTSLIEKGRLKAGSSLPPERQLATQFGVSRVVIREASKKLEERGMVRIRQGIGVEVINNPTLPVEDTLIRLMPQDKERLQQCAQARLLVEPELAALAASRITPAKAKLLAGIHASMDPNLKIDQAIEKDVEFHNAIASLSGNKVLALMLRSVASIGRLSREVTMKKFGIKRARDFHGTILSAIVAGEPAAARQTMKAHLQAALKDLI